MNIKATVFAGIGVFLFIFVYDFVFHGGLMKDWYTETKSLWRPEAEMPLYFRWILAGQGLSALAITVLVTRIGEGAKCGLRIGACVGLILVAGILITYAVQPIPSKIILAWSISAMIQVTLAGGIAAGIYKKCAGSSGCKISKVTE